ncbi:hypothetical protein AKJ16_DCAP02986, partial [Drosera capensis]
FEGCLLQIHFLLDSYHKHRTPPHVLILLCPTPPPSRQHREPPWLSRPLLAASKPFPDNQRRRQSCEGPQNSLGKIAKFAFLELRFSNFVEIYLDTEEIALSHFG